MLLTEVLRPYPTNVRAWRVRAVGVREHTKNRDPWRVTWTEAALLDLSDRSPSSIESATKPRICLDLSTSSRGQALALAVNMRQTFGKLHMDCDWRRRETRWHAYYFNGHSYKASRHHRHLPCFKIRTKLFFNISNIRFEIILTLYNKHNSRNTAMVSAHLPDPAAAATGQMRAEADMDQKMAIYARHRFGRTRPPGKRSK